MWKCVLHVACTTLICGISRVADAVIGERLRSNESEVRSGTTGVHRGAS